MTSPHCNTPCALRDAAVESIARRAFVLRVLSVAAGTLALNACATDLSLPAEPSLTNLGAGGWSFSLADYPALRTISGITAVTVPGGVPIAVVRISEAVFQAFWMSCPHQQTTLTISNAGFTCPNHHAQFATDGSWTGGWPTGHLTEVPLSYDRASERLTLGVAPSVPVTTRLPMTLVVTVANVPALAHDGGIQIYGYGNGYPAALVRIAPANYLALSPVCPHQQYYVDLDPASGGFSCPGHGALFSSLGAWTGGRTQTTALPRLPSSFDAAAGTVTITIP